MKRVVVLSAESANIMSLIGSKPTDINIGFEDEDQITTIVEATLPMLDTGKAILIYEDGS